MLNLFNNFLSFVSDFIHFISDISDTVFQQKWSQIIDEQSICKIERFMQQSNCKQDFENIQKSSIEEESQQSLTLPDQHINHPVN